MRMRQYGGLLFAVVGISVFNVGCDPIKAPGVAQFDPLPEYPKVTALEGLKDWVVVSDVVVDPGPPMEVTVPARAKTDYEELNIQYRFFFYDSAGRPLENDPDWHYMHMPSRTQVYMQANALDTTASDWRLEIRPAR